MAQISKPRGKARAQCEPIEDMELWQSELGRYIEEEADESVSIVDLRRALSVISSSMAEQISAERDER